MSNPIASLLKAKFFQSKQNNSTSRNNDHRVQSGGSKKGDNDSISYAVEHGVLAPNDNRRTENSNHLQLTSPVKSASGKFKSFRNKIAAVPDLGLKTHSRSHSSIQLQKYPEVEVESCRQVYESSLSSVPRMELEKFPSDSSRQSMSSVNSTTSHRFRTYYSREVQKSSDLATTSSSLNSRSSSKYSTLALKKERSLPLVRRGRSQTIDVSDYVKPRGSSDSRNKKDRRRSDSKTEKPSFRVSLRNKSRGSFHSFNDSNDLSRSISSPRQSRSSSGQNSQLHGTYSATATTSTTPPFTHRKRSGSIVNALSNMVSLKSRSSSSMKLCVNEVSDPTITLDLLPEPPEPAEEDTYKSYLAKLAPYKRYIGVILVVKDSDFKQQTLSYYLSEHFDFKNIPLDISLRILLMLLELPKEAQQIDRLLIEFSKVYYESHKWHCNWVNENQVYFILFSLLMLHTDYFNPNNKSKMTKKEFIDLVHGDTDSFGNKIPKQVLSYYYDNTIVKESKKYCNCNECAEINLSDFSNVTEDQELYSQSILLNTNSSLHSDKVVPAAASFRRSTSNSISAYIPYVSNASTNPLTDNNSTMADDIDIYSHICRNTLHQVNMQNFVDKFWDPDCLDRPLLAYGKHRVPRFNSLYKDIKGGYLKINRDDLFEIATSDFEIIGEQYDSEYLYLKIIQMSDMQELIENKKFSLIGSSNKTHWKKLYAILTTFGLLIFENFQWANPEMIYDDTAGVSNYIIHVPADVPFLHQSLVDCDGMLAVANKDELGRTHFNKILKDFTKNASSAVETFEDLDETSNGNSFGIISYEDDCILYVCNGHDVHTWKFLNKIDRDDWMYSINFTAAYTATYRTPGCIGNTVICLRKYTIAQKMDKLIKEEIEKIQQLRKLQKQLSFGEELIPLSTKTRRDVGRYIGELLIKLDGIVYEIKRNKTYTDIIEHAELHLSGKNTPKQNASEPADNSITVNDQTLHICVSDEGGSLAQQDTTFETIQALKEY